MEHLILICHNINLKKCVYLFVTALNIEKYIEYDNINTRYMSQNEQLRNIKLLC